MCVLNYHDDNSHIHVQFPSPHSKSQYTGLTTGYIAVTDSWTKNRDGITRLRIQWNWWWTPCIWEATVSWKTVAGKWWNCTVWWEATGCARVGAWASVCERDVSADASWTRQVQSDEGMRSELRNTNTGSVSCLHSSTHSVIKREHTQIFLHTQVIALYRLCTYVLPLIDILLMFFPRLVCTFHLIQVVSFTLILYSAYRIVEKFGRCKIWIFSHIC